jgi:hypothetical protein
MSLAATLPEEHLAGRMQFVQRLLRPLSPLRAGPATHRLQPQYNRTANRNEVVIAAYDGPRPGTAFRDWSFATKTNGIRGSYFELWSMAPDDDRWALQQAYLHLVFVEPAGGRRSEILALHCDPNEPAGAPHVVNKRNLHVHVTAAPDPISHAHIALNRRASPSEWDDVSRLAAAWSDAINLLSEEVLARTYPNRFPPRLRHRPGCACECDR